MYFSSLKDSRSVYWEAKNIGLIEIINCKSEFLATGDYSHPVFNSITKAFANFVSCLTRNTISVQSLLSLRILQSKKESTFDFLNVTFKNRNKLFKCHKICYNISIRFSLGKYFDIALILCQISYA